MDSQKKSKRHLTTHYSNILLYDKPAGECLTGLELAACNPLVAENEEKAGKGSVNIELIKTAVVSDSMYCNCCQTQFADRDEQLQHYKCDWHRYNLHVRLRGLQCVSEEEFETIAGDVSSISGSDSESDSETDTFTQDLDSCVECESSSADTESFPSQRRFHKVFFTNSSGELISFYRCLLHHKKKPITEPKEVCMAASQIVNKQKWIVLMVTSGHFAGAVFNGNEIVEHKTFHRYCVRAKRGTAQSGRDSQGNRPKGAGASLRRYNEAALIQEVQELMASWSSHFQSCDLIFVHVPISNRSMFYSGKNPALKKDDERIRIIPFPTKRPTFNEVKRVRQMLASIECYGKEADVRECIPLSPPRIYNKDSGKLEVRPDCPSPKSSKTIAVKNSNKDENIKPEGDLLVTPPEEMSVEHESPEEEVELVEAIETIDLADDLKEFEIRGNKKKRNKKGKKSPENQERSFDEPLLDERQRQFRNEIFTACKAGNADNLLKVLDEIALYESSSASSLNGESEREKDVSANENNDNGPSSSLASEAKVETTESIISKLLNRPLGDNGDSYLHVAAAGGCANIVQILMDKGADPALKNQAGKLPFNLANSELRNTFRRFMAQFPDKYDYVKAQVPSPLTAEMEEQKRQKLAKKRAEKKKAMQERNKVKKAERKETQEEEEQKARFLSLSDREKRALAAEKRILQQHAEQGTANPVLSRCWQCGVDITGKIPFEYSDFKFCTTKCLRDHRAQAKS